MKSAFLPNIYISSSDYDRLSKLVANVNVAVAEDLEEELGRAKVLPDADMPPTVVTMNSTVRVRDLATGTESTYTLVYPENANANEGRISILAPVGVALIGLALDEIIQWPMPGGQIRRLQVIDIMNVAAAS
jgi:regulator of nucleoside diphosphate kinase